MGQGQPSSRPVTCARQSGHLDVQSTSTMSLWFDLDRQPPPLSSTGATTPFCIVSSIQECVVS
jgi:hypothetical protein